MGTLEIVELAIAQYQEIQELVQASVEEYVIQLDALKVRSANVIN